MNEKMNENIDVIQEWISKGKVSRISFIISEPSTTGWSMPVIDYSVEDENGDNLVSDVEFESLSNAIDDLVQELNKRGLK